MWLPFMTEYNKIVFGTDRDKKLKENGIDTNVDNIKKEEVKQMELLKIKDDVDLRELEKFGFHIDEYGTSLTDGEFTTIELYNETSKKFNTRKIYTSTAYLGKVYDLIMAGYVEKVEK